MVNVGIYTIHGWYGIGNKWFGVFINMILQDGWNQKNIPQIGNRSFHWSVFPLSSGRGGFRDKKQVIILITNPNNALSPQNGTNLLSKPPYVYNLTRYKYILWTCHWVIKDIICIPSFSLDGLFQKDTNLRPRIDQSLNGHRMLTITSANNEHLVESCDDLELWRLCIMTYIYILIYHAHSIGI